MIIIYKLVIKLTLTSIIDNNLLQLQPKVTQGCLGSLITPRAP